MDGGLIARELQTIMQVPVGIHRTLVGGEVVVDNNKLVLGSLFFNLETLNNIEENLLKVSKDKEQKLKNYEKLRTVGKGAFGAAILYRKKDDGLMVIIKVKLQSWKALCHLVFYIGTMPSNLNSTNTTFLFNFIFQFIGNQYA